MDVTTYRSLDATDLAERIHKGETSAEAIIQCAFQQLDKVNSELNAVIHNRKARVLSEACNVNKQDQNPFSGVPMLLKNISQAMQGEPLTSGSRLMSSYVAEGHSNFVTKLLNAGFLVMGHTNVPEFALKNITESKLHGAARNPWNIEYSPGGSSGGAAAAVAAGIVPIAGASDGGGSIRIPASFTGLFGLKPTRGRTPVGPGAGRQWQGASIDFVLSRSVRDSGAMLDVMQVVEPAAAFQVPLYEGSYANDMTESFARPLKIAYTTASPVGTPVSDDAVRAVEKTVKWLEREGHIVEEQDNGVDGMQLMRNYFLMNSGEVATVVASMEEKLGRKLTADDMEIETWILNEAGKSVSAAAFSASLASWDEAAAQMARLHEDYDFYLTPTTAFTAPRVGELTFSEGEQQRLRNEVAQLDGAGQQQLIYDMFLPSLTYTPFTQLANLTGQPAMSLPVYVSDNGLPLGVQFMAPKGAEHRLLQLAYQVEQSDIWIGIKPLQQVEENAV
ncbi:amidase [Lentibacillus saliphilus]|uniref:amidase n=1 Tax=Lentibacillus saliphilus TaxID=2737028 RepID=UPI001C2FA49F|nr:amidase [Lentibacillus saliphilus]